MKKQEVYTLTLDFTRIGEPTRKTTWVRQSHRDAMKRLRYALEEGDGQGPLQSWRIDTGVQITEAGGGQA
tara:strand:+ start:181 stop:390 length:210 start_codon:yes stop_codon:yes gene_type:complete